MRVRTAAGLLTAAALATAGCGGGSDDPHGDTTTRPSRPAVAARAVQGDSFFGMPVYRELGNRVRTDPALFSADSPGLYTDPQTAVAELRRDGFVAGITRSFKSMGRPDGASSSVVQMRDTAGVRREFARELASAQAPPCPPGQRCTRRVRRFEVPGLPGAAGVQLTILVAGSHPGHPDELNSQAVIFSKDAFVYQVWLGAERPTSQRSALIAAAKALAR